MRRPTPPRPSARSPKTRSKPTNTARGASRSATLGWEGARWTSNSAHDLSAIFDEHVAHEFVAKDVAAIMATMTTEPFVNHVPTTMGGVGTDQVADFYAEYFIGHWPADTAIIPVCRPVPTASSTR